MAISYLITPTLENLRLVSQLWWFHKGGGFLQKSARPLQRRISMVFATSMRAQRAKPRLLCLLVCFFFYSLIAGSNTNDDSSSSSSYWRNVLNEAHSSVDSASAFSNDDSLIAAASKLDHDLQLYHYQVRMSNLIAQLRQHEKYYTRRHHQDSITYSILTDVNHLTQEQITKAIKEHFRPRLRTIAFLEPNIMVTTIVAKKPASPQASLWGLDGNGGYVLFWNLGQDGREAHFLGLASVSPPTVLRTALNKLPKLEPELNSLWELDRLDFLAPHTIRFPVALVLKEI